MWDGTSERLRVEVRKQDAVRLVNERSIEYESKACSEEEECTTEQEVMLETV